MLNWITCIETIQNTANFSPNSLEQLISKTSSDFLESEFNIFLFKLHLGESHSAKWFADETVFNCKFIYERQCTLVKFVNRKPQQTKFNRKKTFQEIENAINWK